MITRINFVFPRGFGNWEERKLDEAVIETSVNWFGYSSMGNNARQIEFNARAMPISIFPLIPIFRPIT